MKEEKKVITFGVFDLLHKGHIRLFKRARKYGTFLTVAVQTDQFVIVNKPNCKLIDNFDKRCEKIKATGYVDQIIPYEQIDETIKTADFDVLVVGGDQNNPHFQRAFKYVRENNKELVRLSRTRCVSSSKLRKKPREVSIDDSENLDYGFIMPWSLYPKANFKKYGFTNKAFKLYRADGDLFSTYNDTLQMCFDTNDKIVIKNIRNFIKSNNIRMISGPVNVVKQLSKKAGCKKFEVGFICEIDSIEDADIECFTAKEENEFKEIGELLYNSNSATNEFYFTAQQQAESLMSRSKEGYTRTLYYKKDGKIVATISTYAETEDYVVIGGFAVHPDYRRQHIGSALFKKFIKTILNENKKIYLFDYNKDILPFYLKYSSKTYDFAKFYRKTRA